MSEGGNHIHLAGLTESPIAQFALGISLLRSWHLQLRQKKRGPQKIVFYLHESQERVYSRDIILCVYSDPDRADIRQLEQSWLKPVTVVSLKKFIEWSKT